MKQRQLTLIAVACGVVCAACVALFMTSVQGEADAARAEALARYGGEQVEAYVATRDIVAGERVDLASVETRLWVADLLPENAVRTSADAVGKTATSTIFKGEVITAGRFEAGRDALDVPVGKQAVSVPAKAVQAVGGAIRAGMSVDIYSSGDSTTKAIDRNVSVLDSSVGNSGALTSGDSGWVTLAVDPEKVQELIAASSKTTLYFTLPGEAAPSGDAVNGDDAAPGRSGGAAGQDANGARTERETRGEASTSSAASERGTQTAQGDQSTQDAQTAQGSQSAKASKSATKNTSGGDR